MANKVIDVSLSEDLLEELDQTANEQSRTRDEILGDAARRYLSERRWNGIQSAVSTRAREVGLYTEDDIQRLVDSLEE